MGTIGLFVEPLRMFSGAIAVAVLSFSLSWVALHSENQQPAHPRAASEVKSGREEPTTWASKPGLGTSREPFARTISTFVLYIVVTEEQAFLADWGEDFSLSGQ